MKTILLIDDDTVLRELFRTVLEDTYTVLEAGDGKEALSLFQYEKPNLVITDMGVPVIGEFELIRAIRSMDSTVKIIVCSGGSNQFQYEELTIKAGADL